MASFQIEEVSKVIYGSCDFMDGSNLKSYNIIANLKGVFNTDDTIVLGAHHDTTFDSLGANDNASGLSVLLETARLLKQLKS